MATYNGTAGDDALPMQGQSLTGSDTLNGLGGNDVLTYSIRNEISPGYKPEYISLNGNADNDTIRINFVGAYGNTRDKISIDGGSGDDTLILDYSNATDTNIIDLSPSNLPRQSTPQYPTYYPSTGLLPFDSVPITGIEHFNIIGSGGSDIMLAGAGDDTVSGGAGNDSLAGGAGDDALRGGTNNDTLNGGTGNDTMTGGMGDDALYSNSNQGVDSLDGGVSIDFAKVDRAQTTTAFIFDLTDPSTTQTLVDGTSIVNVERIQFEAGSGNDVLTGGALNDILAGNNGSDTLNGGGGDDILIAGRGFNQVDGGAGNDTLQLSGRRADYRFARNADGTYIAINPSSFAPDGSGASNPEVDTFSNIETIHFADGYNKLNALVR